MKKIYISEEQKKRLKKAIAAQDQVGGKVNAGIMDAVAGGEMCCCEDIDDSKYEIGHEDGGFEPYYHIITESPDSCDGSNTDLLTYRDEEAITFSYVKELKKFYVADGRSTHVTMLKNLEKSGELGRELSDYEKSMGLYDNFDLMMTGRYWPSAKIISFWKTPIEKANRNKLSAVVTELKQRGILDPRNLYIDVWDKGGFAKYIPYAWFFNGTYDMYSADIRRVVLQDENKGIVRVELNNNAVYFAKNDGVLTDYYGIVGENTEVNANTITLYHGVNFKGMEYVLNSGCFTPRVCSEGGPCAIWLSEKQYGYPFIFKFEIPRDLVEQMTNVDYVYTKGDISLGDYNCTLVKADFTVTYEGFLIHVDLMDPELGKRQIQLAKDLPERAYETVKQYPTIYSTYVLPYFEDICGQRGTIKENHEWCDDFVYAPYLKSLANFIQDNGINVKPFPKVIINRDEQEGLYVKTGYYDPDKREVHLFAADRHPKDVLRSFAHEMIHHSQNLKGILTGYKGETLKGDDNLQKLESEAYLKGNIYFRKWTEELHPVLPNKKQKLNESMQDILNISDDFDEYGVGKIINEFFSDKRRGVAKKQWSLIPAQQYQNLLSRYMQDPIMARIPDNLVYKWFMQVVRNVYDLEWMTELCGHTNGLDIDSAREAIDYEFGEGEYEINDWHDVIDLLGNYGFDDWCRLPDDSPACTDYGLQPLFKELSYYKPGMSGGDLLVLLNRVLHVGHVNGDLASAFIEGGSRSCSQISGIVRESNEVASSFNAWFGASKVVDKNGNPLPMYHGTDAEFTAFSKEYFANGSQAYLGVGFNFSSSDATATGYGKNVHEVYLKAEHPLTNREKKLTVPDICKLLMMVDGDENPDGSISSAMLGYRVENLSWVTIHKVAQIIYNYSDTDADIYSQFGVAYSGDDCIKIVNAFEKFGYDSAIRYGYNDRIDTVVVFEPNQIKSINAQNFNPESDEIIDEDFDMAETTEPEEVDLSSFIPNENLNSRFWKDGKLDPEIRKYLLTIAYDFIDTLNTDWVEPEDVIMTGSLANYNWSKQHSDVDLHVVMDFAKVDENVELVKEYFDSKRRLWNEEHGNITIGGFPVELYVQDMREEHASTGVYSLESNRWLVMPSLENFEMDFDDELVKEKVADYMNIIDDLCDEYEESVADCDLSGLHRKTIDVFKRIKDERKNALSNGGKEYSEGNLIFKTLRRNGYIGKLDKLRKDTYDELNSLDD